jgi:hypothetical protein
VSVATDYVTADCTAEPLISACARPSLNVSNTAVVGEQPYFTTTSTATTTSQEIFRSLYNSDIHYRMHKRPTPVPT